MKTERDWYQVSLKVFLRRKDGKVLALKARSGENESMSGYFDFPGGRIDVGEFALPFSSIVKRELREEIGNIDFRLHEAPVALGRHRIPGHMQKDGKEIRVLYVFFLAEYINGDIVVSGEHLGARWTDLFSENLDQLFCSGNLEGAKMFIKSAK